MNWHGHFAYGDAAMWLKCVWHPKNAIFMQNFAMSATPVHSSVKNVIRSNIDHFEYIFIIICHAEVCRHGQFECHSLNIVRDTIINIIVLIQFIVHTSKKYFHD